MEFGEYSQNPRIIRDGLHCFSHAHRFVAVVRDPENQMQNAVFQRFILIAYWQITFAYIAYCSYSYCYVFNHCNGILTDINANLSLPYDDAVRDLGVDS